MMTGPLAIVRFTHGEMEVYGPAEGYEKGTCCTVFHSDGARVPAAPNGSETLLDTLAHEWAHSAVAQVLHDRPSVCLRGVAEGHGRRWDPEKHQEESLAYSLGLLLADLLKALTGEGGRRSPGG